MTFGEGLVKALYVSVGAIAVGVEALADVADKLAVKGEEVVAKGKEMFNEIKASRQVSDEEDPAVVIEEDNGENAPIPNN